MSFDPNAPAKKDSGIFGLDYTYDESRIVLIPVPYEATTSYAEGTANGPKVIAQASKQVDLYDFSTGHPYRAGIYMLNEMEEIWRLNQEAKQVVSYIRKSENNDIVTLQSYIERVNSYSAKVNHLVYETASKALAQEKIIGTIGGDHSTVFGAIQAYNEHYTNLGILHIDAHADLRNSYEGFTWSHASIMHNIITYLPNISKIVQVGIRDLCEAEMQTINQSQGRIVSYFDDQLSTQKFSGISWKTITEEIISQLPENVYISFDIDGLDPSLCPHTGTPVPGGLSFQEVITVISTLANSGRHIVGFDLVEVSPGPYDEWDANVGARVLYKMIGYTLLTN